VVASVPDLGAEKPVHNFASEEQQFRVSVQEFTHLPPHIVVREQDFGRDVDRMMEFYRRQVPFTHSGQELHMRQRKAKKRDPNRIRTADQARDAASRARRRCSNSVHELCPTDMLTLTSRGLLVTRDQAWKALGFFVPWVRKLDSEFETVSALERHVKGDFHLHVAVRMKSLSFNTLRRLWHQALHKALGLPVPKEMLRGPAAPGNVVSSKHQKRSGAGAWWRITDPVKLTEVLARYLGKYLGKELEREFNRRSFAPSKGVKVKPRRSAYLQALVFREAVREVCARLGLLDALDAGLLNPWEKDDRVWYCRVPSGVWSP
jgi:hypothetical protein